MKPFLSGRAQVTVAPLQSLASTPAKSPAPRHHHGHASGAAAKSGGEAAPQVECVRQGDKITRLIVTCSCGERIEIECLYPAGG